MSYYYLGIDFGTQSVKCVICEFMRCSDDQNHHHGKIILTGKSSALDVHQEQDGYAEQDPLQWISAMKEAINNALKQDETNTIRNKIAAISISGQQHGLVALDKENNIIRPCMLWCDTRASLEAKDITNFSGRSIPAGFTAPKIMWMIKHEPENFHRTDKFMLPHDYINYYLTGYKIFTMECGDASGTGLIDYSTREWDHKSLNYIHRDLHTKLPSNLTPPGQCIASIDPNIAMELGISNEGNFYTIILAPGCGDNAMTILGISSVSYADEDSRGSATNPLLVSLGTSGTIMLTSPIPLIDPNGNVALFSDATGQWLSLVCVQNCSMVPDEILNSFIASQYHLDASKVETVSSLRADLIARASKVPAGCEGVTLLPYFSSGGERTPNWPQSSGCFLGLRHGHLQQPELMYRAALEGVTYSLYRGYQELIKLSNPANDGKFQLCDEICIVGGGAQNLFWKQLIADIFQLPVSSPAPEIGNHAAAIGAAVQAMATFNSIPFESIRIVSHEEMIRYNPTDRDSEGYCRGYERHVRFSNLLFGGDYSA